MRSGFTSVLCNSVSRKQMCSKTVAKTRALSQCCLTLLQKGGKIKNWVQTKGHFQYNPYKTWVRYRSSFSWLQVHLPFSLFHIKIKAYWKVLTKFSWLQSFCEVHIKWSMLGLWHNERQQKYFIFKISWWPQRTLTRARSGPRAFSLTRALSKTV